MFSNNRFSRGNVLLALLAVVLFIGALALLCWDVFRTFNRDTSMPTAVRISNENLRLVSDPKNGWFPYHREPVYDWEDGTQGWLLESDQGLNATGAQLPSDPDLQPPPSMPTTATKASGGGGLKTAGQKLGVVTRSPSQGKKALSIPVNFPQPATIFRSNSQSGDAYRMVGVRFISYDVYLPIECPGFVGCLFFMKDKDGLWYQARSRAALLPGRWTTVTADIRGGSPDVTPLGHQGQWDDNQATQIRTLGLTFHGDKSFNGTILIDNFRGWVRANKFIQNIAAPVVTPVAEPVKNSQTPQSPQKGEMPKPKKLSTETLIQMAESYKEAPLSVLNLRTQPAASQDASGKTTGAPSVRKFETLTVRFELNRQVDNPFDPEQADVTCTVTTPSKKVLEHIGFWYQDYDRKDRFAGDELEPIGRPEWRVRITPREEGEYTYVLRVRLKKDELVLPAAKFKVTASNPSARGFVRVSKSDPRFFEFENGEFYYPIGHNLHSPVDMRCWNQILFSEAPAGRGLPMYADFFPKMQKAGENTAEVWMASWWLGIEWTSKWRDYYGKGRYSLQHAWKLDRLLEMAREHDIRIHLVLDNHGKFSTYCDWEWDGNPYNMRADPINGVCNSAADFFQNEYAKIGHKNKLRYVAARWGADPTIMGFELVSEFDLVGGEGTTIREQRKMSARQTFHRTSVPQNWVREMIPALKKLDVYDHLVSNHYATDYKWVDSVLAKEKMADGQPLFDYIVTDAYRPPQIGGYVLPAVDMQDWYNTKIAPSATKPFWITEYGGDFNAAAAASLDADVHCGLWATWMTDGAGTPLMWWYDFVDQNNLYTYYDGFSKYVAGEDRRGIKGVMKGPHGGGKVDHQIYQWANGAYMWVYDPKAMYSMPPISARKPIDGVTETISGLQPGAYKVEFWDCYTGVVVKTENVQVTGNALPLSFPSFMNNMAVKVKQVK